MAFAYRDHEDQEEYGSQPLPKELKAIDLPAVRATGIEAAARQAVDHLTREELDGFFIHLDADCLDDTLMPAAVVRWYKKGYPHPLLQSKVRDRWNSTGPAH